MNFFQIFVQKPVRAAGIRVVGRGKRSFERTGGAGAHGAPTGRNRRPSVRSTCPWTPRRRPGSRSPAPPQHERHGSSKLALPAPMRTRR